MTNLKYGMKILFPCSPITTVISMMNISLTSSDTPKEMIEMEICKYWEKDTDPNRYKVTLKPIKENDKLRFGYEKLYSDDLKSLIREKFCKIITD